MNVMKSKLARAISLTLAGGALSMGVVSNASAISTTMYNGYIDTAATPGATDGWVWGNGSTSAAVGYHPSNATRQNGYLNPNGNTPADGNGDSINNTIGVARWIGIGGDSNPSTLTPFGYVGSSHLNWAVDFTGGGNEFAEISSEDAHKNYQFYAEVDTGAGAWMDNGTTPTGWKHQTDIGLIKTDVDSVVTLNVLRIGATSSPGLPNDNFGITIFTGMDTNSDNTIDSNTDGIRGYAHHGAWNAGGNPSVTNNPFGTNGVNYLKHDGSVDAINSISFNALANQVYSIYLGGAGVGSWSQNVSEYQLNISVSQVPVPAAAWLFGGALMSLVGSHRRRKRILPA